MMLNARVIFLKKTLGVTSDRKRMIDIVLPEEVL